MKRFFGMMPSSEVEISKTFKDDCGFKDIIQAGKKGWTIIYADYSTEYKDVEDSAENNFKSALSVLKSRFFSIVTECDDEFEQCLEG